MRILRIIGFSLVIAVAAVAADPPQSSISVRELPPEAIPAGTCTKSVSGHLEFKNGSKTQNTNVTAKQIGEYVADRLKAGYSLAMYPQVSGRVFVIETCESAKR